jgi:hypothetical protein
MHGPPLWLHCFPVTPLSSSVRSKLSGPLPGSLVPFASVFASVDTTLNWSKCVPLLSRQATSTKSWSSDRLLLSRRSQVLDPVTLDQAHHVHWFRTSWPEDCSGCDCAPHPSDLGTWWKGPRDHSQGYGSQQVHQCLDARRFVSLGHSAHIFFSDTLQPKCRPELHRYRAPYCPHIAVRRALPDVRRACQQAPHWGGHGAVP